MAVAEVNEPGPSLATLAVARLRPAPLDVAVALLILGLTPAMTAVALRAAAWVTDGRAARLTAQHAPALAAARAVDRRARDRAAIAPLLTRPTVSGVAARLTATLPADARVQALELSADTLRAEIDCPDPDVLIDALAADPLLRRLRRAGQQPASGDGVRVVLEAAVG